jgi:hypothetical protein
MVRIVRSRRTSGALLIFRRMPEHVGLSYLLRGHGREAATVFVRMPVIDWLDRTTSAVSIRQRGRASRVQHD